MKEIEKHLISVLHKPADAETVILTHIKASLGDYDTFCGLDVNNDLFGVSECEEVSSPVVDCPDCLKLCQIAWDLPCNYISTS